MDLRDDTSVWPPGTGSAALSAALPSLPSNAYVPTHQVSTRVAGAGDEAIDAIGLRLSTRALLTAGIQHRPEHAVGQRLRKVNLDPPHGAAPDAQGPGDLP